MVGHNKSLTTILPSEWSAEKYHSQEGEDGKFNINKNLGLTRDTRATVGLVFDQRTHQFLLELKKKGIFNKLFGCISTGKEANVYYALVNSNISTSNNLIPDSSVPDINFVKNEDSIELQSELEIINDEFLISNDINSSSLCIFDKNLNDQSTENDFKVLDTSIKNKEINSLENIDIDINNYFSESSYTIAVKIFKTSILTFKDRSKYIEGEFRFRYGYQRSKNPRKMVRQWAEKEYRNLLRCHRNCLRTPKPLALKGHIIAMEFLGFEFDQPSKSKLFEDIEILSPSSNTHIQPCAPKLKDVELTSLEWRRIYIEVISQMRFFYQKAKLVHGDLSEYNILFHNMHPYFIDLSQSVESDHPNAMEFLKLDCLNISKFFKKCFNSYTEEPDLQVKPEHNSTQHLTSNTASSLNNLFYEPLSQKYGNDNLMSHEKLEVLTSSIIYPSESQTDLKQNINNFDINYPVIDSQSNPLTAFESFTKNKNVVNLEVILNQIDILGVKFLFELILDENLFQKHISKDANFSIEKWPVYDNSNHLDDKSLSIYDLYNRIYINTSLYCIQQTINRTKKQDEELDNIFLQTWIPSNLQQFHDLELVEKELERKNKGDTLYYERLFNIKNPSYSTSDDIKNMFESTIESQEENDTLLTSEDNEFDKELISSKLTTGVNLITDSNIPSKNESTSSDSNAKEIRFEGFIPEGMDKKDWKKLVKEMNQERRKTKIPKHVKKRASKQKR